MGYFTINLPNNIHGEVRWGKVSKLDKQLFTLLQPWRKFQLETKTGYIIKLSSAFVNETEYKLFKSPEGIWSQDADGKVQLQEPIALAIRKAIEEHETVT